MKCQWCHEREARHEFCLLEIPPSPTRKGFWEEFDELLTPGLPPPIMVCANCCYMLKRKGLRSGCRYKIRDL